MAVHVCLPVSFSCLPACLHAIPQELVAPAFLRVHCGSWCATAVRA